MTQVTPKKWLEHLEGAVDSRSPTKNQTVGKRNGHRYIALKGEQYTLQGRTAKRLSLEAIVKVSTQKFEEMKGSFQSKAMSETDFLKDSKQLKEHTIKLIEASEAKYNRLGNKLLRVAALIVALVWSLFFGAGIPLFYKLRREDQAFHDDIAKLKDAISNPIDEEITDIEEIGKQLATISEISKQLEPDKVRAKMLQHFLDEDYDHGTTPVVQFAKDMQRGDTFTRNDPDSQIHDTAPRPSPEIQQDKKVENAVLLLNELVKAGNDRKWIIPLQSMANQNSLLALVSTFLNKFNFSSGDNPWRNPINGKQFYLRVDFSASHHPSINLEVVRDQTTHEIKEVKVSVEGFLDVVKRPFSGGKGQLILPGGIKGEMTYSIIFNNENRPTIQNLKRTFTAITQSDTPITQAGA